MHDGRKSWSDALRRSAGGRQRRPFRLGRPFGATRGLISCVALLTACETSVVSVAEVAEVEVSPPQIVVVEGSREAASVIVKESGGAVLSDRAVTWTVDDPEVATVTQEGVVDGRSPGSTRIYASSEGVSGAAEVTVLRRDTESDPNDPSPDEPDPDEPDPSPTCDIRDRVLEGDFEIPKHTSCVLTNVRVGGKLTLLEGASLIASGLRVDEHVRSEHAGEVVLRNAQIGGDVEIKKGGSAIVDDSEIDGKLRLESNRGSIEVRRTLVEEDVVLEKNEGGPFLLRRNTIGGKLECKKNEPPPIGTGNVADDGKKGQCRTL